ncbi:MAG: hypothetical protein RQ899_06995 [Pseudomonadales bacterium]|nr:hypothetical protein [Pseudomonadales bacterium]
MTESFYTQHMFATAPADNKNSSHAVRKTAVFLIVFGYCLGLCANAQTRSDALVPAMAGAWVINDKLSDDTDHRVEVALKAAGQKVKRRWFDNNKEYYRGGPPEQELYDRISYDKVLHIELKEPTYTFIYADDFQRPVYTDNRSQAVNLNAIEDVEDFSFAHWEGEKLLVEARPRDGGFTQETYTLAAADDQLHVKLYIQPKGFQVAVEILRIYDRKPE